MSGTPSITKALLTEMNSDALRFITSLKLRPLSGDDSVLLEGAFALAVHRGGLPAAGIWPAGVYALQLNGRVYIAAGKKDDGAWKAVTVGQKGGAS